MALDASDASQLVLAQELALVLDASQLVDDTRAPVLVQESELVDDTQAPVLVLDDKLVLVQEPAQDDTQALVPAETAPDYCASADLPAQPTKTPSRAK